MNRVYIVQNYCEDSVLEGGGYILFQVSKLYSSIIFYIITIDLKIQGTKEVIRGVDG